METVKLTLKCGHNKELRGQDYAKQFPNGDFAGQTTRCPVCHSKKVVVALVAPAAIVPAEQQL